MITCLHARQLFDRHLDDELPPSLRAELHAHLLQCSECQAEMAILEACGDVIRLDRREPKLAASFTDRVMAARRAAPVASGRRWRRLLYYVASPMAAAASVVLAFLVFSPVVGTDDAPSVKPTAIASEMIAPPAPFRQAAMQRAHRSLTPREKAELEQTPTMSATSFLDYLLAPVVEGTKNTVDGTRRSAKDMEALIMFAFDSMSDQLAAEFRERYPEDGFTPSLGKVGSDVSPLMAPFPAAVPALPSPPPPQAEDDRPGPI
ncbi:MAG: zf-HC2 domain-containing protein [Phycisphaerae bacterium]|nr:zf-HC2 domain-containing protein [Phycisphaerae bacterium]